MTRKRMTALVALCAVVGLAGCSSEEVAAAPTPTAETSTSPATTTPQDAVAVCSSLIDGSDADTWSRLGDVLASTGGDVLAEMRAIDSELQAAESAAPVGIADALSTLRAEFATLIEKAEAGEPHSDVLSTSGTSMARVDLLSACTDAGFEQPFTS